MHKHLSYCTAALILWAVACRAGFELSPTNYLIVADSPSFQQTNGLTVTFGFVGINIGCAGFNTFVVYFQRGFSAAIPWRIWHVANNFSGVPGGEGQWALYYEGPGRNPNDWIAGLAPSVQPARNLRMETFAIAFGNASPKAFDDQLTPTAGSWRTGAGTDMGTNVNERIEIGPSQKGVCGGTYSMGYERMSEVSIYNTNLTTIQCQNLNRSHVKRMPLQIRPQNLILYVPADAYPDGTWISSTNSLRDWSGKNNHASPATNVGQILIRAERICSYPPNE